MDESEKPATSVPWPRPAVWSGTDGGESAASVPFPDIPGYELISLIGSGGFGHVFKARQSGLGRHVAIKFLHPGLARDPEFRKMFRREGQVLAKLDHEHIVRAIEIGGGEDTMWMVMEHIEGRTLAERMEEGVDTGTALQILDDICEALGFAHANGVIHRDIKPSNILIDPAGRARVVDFGLARVHVDQTRLQTSRARGTPGYAAPEQITGEDVDERTDIYALGVLAYNLLTGQIPSPGSGPPSTLNPAITENLDQVVMTAMRSDPAERPRDAAAFLEALRAPPAAKPRRHRGFLAAALVGLLGLATAWTFAPRLLDGWRSPAQLPQALAEVPLEADISWPNETNGLSPATDRFGRAGGALAFSGSNSFFTVQLPKLDTVTVSWWARVPATGEPQEGTLIDLMPSYLIRLSGRDLQIRTRAGTLATNAPWTTDTRLPDVFEPGTWHHLAWGRDATTGQQRVFVDGILAHEADLAAGPMPPANAYDGHMLGATRGDPKTDSIRVQLDDIRYYNELLGPQAVALLHQAPDQYEAVVADAEELFRLDFEQGLHDASGEKLRGEAVALVDGPQGKAAEFNGSDARLYLPSELSESIRGGSFSLSLDVQALDPDTPSQVIAHCGGANSGFHVLNSHPRSLNCHSLHLFGAGGTEKSAGSMLWPPLDRWRHLALLWEEGTRCPNVFLDGHEMSNQVVDEFGADATVWPAEPAALVLGGCHPDGETFGKGFKGRIDNVRVYKGLLTREQIRKLSTP